jgi:hypothetical protein
MIIVKTISPCLESYFSGSRTCEWNELLFEGRRMKGEAGRLFPLGRSKLSSDLYRLSVADRTLIRSVCVSCSIISDRSTPSTDRPGYLMGKVSDS